MCDLPTFMLTRVENRVQLHLGQDEAVTSIVVLLHEEEEEEEGKRKAQFEAAPDAIECCSGASAKDCRAKLS